MTLPLTAPVRSALYMSETLTTLLMPLLTVSFTPVYGDYLKTCITSFHAEGLAEQGLDPTQFYSPHVPNPSPCMYLERGHTGRYISDSEFNGIFSFFSGILFTHYGSFCI